MGASACGQIFLGDEDFIDQVRGEGLNEARKPRDSPCSSTAAGQAVEPLHEDGQWSRCGIVAAYLDGGHTQTVIAGAIGLSVSRVSRLIKAHEAKGKT